MKHAIKIILLLFLLLSGCGSDPYRRVYETIKNRDDGFKSSADRSLSPAPNYGIYNNEREQLRNRGLTTDTNTFKDPRKLDEYHDVSTFENNDAHEHRCTGECLSESKPATPILIRAQ